MSGTIGKRRPDGRKERLVKGMSSSAAAAVGEAGGGAVCSEEWQGNARGEWTGVDDDVRRESVAGQERPPYWRPGVDPERNKNPAALGTARVERCGREKSERRGQGSVRS